MTDRNEFLFDGLKSDELLDLSWEEVEAWICRDDPIVFTVSEAEVLGQFGLRENELTAQISVVEGGGDGVLFQLFSTIERLARHHGVTKVTWQVHALNCKKPNLKLQRVLQGYNFEIVNPTQGAAYFQKVTSTNDSVMRRKRQDG